MAKKSNLFIFNAYDQLLAILSNHSQKACPFWSAPFKELINQSSTFEFTATADHNDSQYIVAENQVGFFDKDGDFRLFNIREIEESDGADGPEVHAICEDGMLELNDSLITDKRPYDTTAEAALTDALEGTRVQVGAVASLGINSTNFYYESSTSAVTKAINTWGGEYKFRAQLTDSQITGRFIDLLPRRGADTGKRWTMTKDIEKILRSVQSYPKTALYGRGSSLETDEGGFTRKITFAGVEWSVANGDPADKPAGQEWVGDPDALAVFGRPMPGGSLKHREGTFEDSEEKDPAALLQKTWDDLQQKKKQLENFELDVFMLEDITGYEHEKVRLGDTTFAINRRFAKPIEVEERVVSFEYDVADPDNTGKVEMGQFIDLFSDDARLDDLEAKLNDKSGLIDQASGPVTDSDFPDTVPPVPENLEVTGLFSKVLLQWDYVIASYIAAYEVYTSQIVDFTPDVSNLVWRGKSGSFTFDAEVNQQWYFKVRAINTHGTPSAFTSELMGQTVRIQNIDIAIGAVNADKLADLAVTATKLADGSVGTQKILDDAIQAAKIAANAVTELKIANGAISNPKLANLSVDALKLANGAVTDLKIFDGAVTETKIANLAISAGKLKDGIVDDTKLANLAVTAGKLADGSVTNAKVGNNAINNAKLADLAVNAAKLEAGSVNDTKLDRTTIDRIVIGTADIANAAIGSAEIANLAVGTAAISTGAITNAKIANLAVDTAEIADAAIQSAKIANLAVGNAAIANLAVSSGKIQDLAVGNVAIANGAITNAKIGSLAVDTAQLNNAAITEAKIANLAVGTAAIQDLAVTNAKVQRLSADKVTIGSGTSFDPNFDPTTKETPTGAQDKADGAESSANTYTQGWSQQGADVTANNASKSIALEDTRGADETPDWYYANYPRQVVSEFKYSSTFGGIGSETYGTLITRVQWSDSSGGKVKQEFTIGNDVFYRQGTGTTWEAWRTAEDTNGSQSKANAAEQSAKDYRDLWAYPNTTYIDGGNIYTNSVTANEMATRTITAASGIIADAAITTAKVANLAVGNAAITNGAITNAKIANLAVSTAQIINGAITNAKIGNLAVDDAKIASVSATKMRTGTLEAIDIFGVNITGSNIVGDDGNGNKVEIMGGYIKTYQGNTPIMLVNSDGLSMFSSADGQIAGTLRDSNQTVSTVKQKGIDLMGHSDFVSLGFRSTGGTSYPWVYLDHDDFLADIYGSNVPGIDSGRLNLQSTRHGGTADGKVPALSADSYTSDDGIHWSSIVAQTGRDNSRPGGGRFGFEVWQYQGTGTGANKELFEIDTDSGGVSYAAVYADETYLPARTWMQKANGNYNHGVAASMSTKITSAHGALDGIATLAFEQTSVTMASTVIYDYIDFSWGGASNIFQVWAQPTGSSSVYYAARVYNISPTGFRVYLTRMGYDRSHSETCTIQLMVILEE